MSALGTLEGEVNMRGGRELSSGQGGASRRGVGPPPGVDMRWAPPPRVDTRVAPPPGVDMAGERATPQPLVPGVGAREEPPKGLDMLRRGGACACLPEPDMEGERTAVGPRITLITCEPPSG